VDCDISSAVWIAASAVVGCGLTKFWMINNCDALAARNDRKADVSLDRIDGFYLSLPRSSARSLTAAAIGLDILLDEGSPSLST